MNNQNPPHNSLSDEQLLRYSRQILLPQFDVPGQQRICDATVAVIGLGGLGSPVSMYLAAAGVGELILIDHDDVELSNLQRQIVHREQAIGSTKVSSARDTLAALAPCTVHAHATQISQHNIESLLQNADIVVDCCDNFATRFLLNQYCVTMQKPWVSGAAIRMEGQVSVFDPRVAGSPCYRCLYDENSMTDAQESCATTGVLAPVVGIIGSIQATEVLKVQANVQGTLLGKLLIMDALHMEWRTLKLNQDPQCPVCGL